MGLGQKKRTESEHYLDKYRASGAANWNRTSTSEWTPDFESSASTNSAIAAQEERYVSVVDLTSLPIPPLAHLMKCTQQLYTKTEWESITYEF